MAEAGETSLAPPSSSAVRPLVVRVKRKPSQSPLEAFWLEISERPLKRALLDLEKLSLSASPGKEESWPKRVFVKHVETVRSSEATIDALQSFVQPGSDGGRKSVASTRARHTSRKDNKQIQLLLKAKQDQEALAKSARFEQIWRSRRGNKEVVHDDALHEACRLYDVVRVDAEGTSGKANKQELMSKEDQDSLSKFLPMLKELVPEAADDIESDMCSYASEQEGFVYDLYTVEDDPGEMDASHPFPLVQVNDDDDWWGGPDDSECETDDSNAENHPLNDYPDEEESDSEDESKKSSTDESEEKESGSEESTESDDQLDNYNYDSDLLDDARNARSDNEDGGDEEDWRWALG